MWITCGEKNLTIIGLYNLIMAIHIKYVDGIHPFDVIFPKNDIAPLVQSVGREIIDQTGVLPLEAESALVRIAGSLGLEANIRHLHHSRADVFVNQAGFFGISREDALKMPNCPSIKNFPDLIEIQAPYQTASPRTRAEFAARLASLRRSAPTADKTSGNAQIAFCNRILDIVQLGLGIEEITFTE